MKILFITQWCTPEPNFKSVPFASALRALGHEVEILTGYPNYPGGKVYPGYRIGLYQREIIDGVPVTRVPLYPSHDASGLRRALTFTSFALSAMAMGPFLVKKPDVAYVCQLPTAAVPAIMNSAIRGVPFVYDILDIWPDSISATGMMKSGRALRLVDWWCGFTYRRAARIAVISDGFKRILMERGVPGEKIEVIYNWCDETQTADAAVDPILADELGLSGRFNVMFAGTMGRAQALDSVLEAARRVAPISPRIQFVFIGGGIEVPRLRQRAEDMGLRNVRFLPRRPVSEIGRVLVLADVLLVHLKDDPLFEITIPSKTQGYMAIGKPVLMAVRGDAARMVRDAGAGVCCAPEDPEAIARAAIGMSSMPREALAEMGARGKKYYWEEISMAAGARRFEALFQEVAGRAGLVAR